MALGKIKDLISLGVWIAGLLLIGSIMGSLTKAEVHTWYETLNRSTLTPANYVFGIAWTILYVVIAVCGWMIWRQKEFPELVCIKSVYIIQLILNWSWTPLFFLYHLTGLSLVCLILLNICVFLVICFSYVNIRKVSLMMMPYLMWIMFAAYLNFYVWQHN